MPCATKKRPPETRTYKNGDAAAEVDRWCELYPWYRELVGDIRHTLATRGRRNREADLPPEYKHFTRPTQ